MLIVAALLAAGCIDQAITQATAPVELQFDIKAPFRFVAYGDTRFHDPKDSNAANPLARVTLVQGIANASPSFVCFTGDIVYNGDDADDWKVFDSETQIWRDKNIPVYPALGNHDLHGKDEVALGNFFHRFPHLRNSRYYSVRAANSLVLVLDSALDETSGPQGDWLTGKLDHVPADVDFVFVMDHHPPYTSSSDEKKYGGGHSSRGREHLLAKILESHQATARYRIVMFSGHVHNYERHEHGGVTYFVSGGGAAHAYPIPRAPGDPFQSDQVNYHYLLVEVDHQQMKVTMNRVDVDPGRAVWTQPDTVTIGLPAKTASQPAGR